jgi:NAD(P)-dependent dehydrogenase (short-subunit alcohol dehydrogenase family)
MSALTCNSITGSDPMFALSNTPDPEEPDLSILNIDLIGVMYTIKCAQHYWQFDSRPADEKCFIIKSSLAGYVTVAGASQYSAAKYGVRGLMIQMRMSDRCRVNLIAPWFIKTAIMSETIADRITAMLDTIGTGWAEVEDSVKAVLRVASDKQVNGRALAIVPRSDYADGYVDLEDDFKDGTDLAKWASWANGFNHRTLPKEQQ